MSGGNDATAVERAELLPEDARQALRDLLLTLADNKRVMGIRYSDWMLGAPTLESGISASSMAQDEWGHGRLTYALLTEFGDATDAIEHGREGAEYRSVELLDTPISSWAELIALAFVLDTAVAVQYGALVESRYVPVRNRVQKLLDEEDFHFQYAAGWVRMLARSPKVRGELRDALAAFLPQTLRWFGREEATRRLREEGLVREGPEALRERYLDRIGPVLEEVGLAGEVGLERSEGRWRAPEPSWEGWSDASRRSGGPGPDAETLARVRGDKNRALLMD
jgi:ring-1,2-phenylacetyl-CoA epoxidase subunit PaaC